MPATTRWECIRKNRTPLKLEFVGSQPSEDEVAALYLALQRLLLSQRNGAASMNAWRLMMRFADATLEDLRRQTIARWDVF